MTTKEQRGLTICRIAEDYPVGGKPNYGLQPVFYYLSREQARAGYNVHVLSRKHGPHQPAEEQNDGVIIHRVENPFNVTAYNLLRELTKKYRSVVHTHSTAGEFIAPLKSTIDAPIFSQVHGTSRSGHMPITLSYGKFIQGFSPSKMWYYYFRERYLWSSADCIFAVSAAVKTDLSKYYKISNHKIRIVFNGVDTALFRPIANPEFPTPIKNVEGKKVVLYVGHFGPRKGVTFLIRAMKKITERVDDAVLVCVGGVPSWLGGSDYWAFLLNSIKENGLEGKVYLLDKVPNETLPIYYSLSKVFVLPSYYEAFPKVVIEAMACGKPVVATNEGGPTESVEEGQSGLLVKYGSADEISKSVITILQDDVLARRMGDAARKRIERDFTWTAVVNRMSEAYLDILRSN